MSYLSYVVSRQSSLGKHPQTPLISQSVYCNSWLDQLQPRKGVERGAFRWPSQLFRLIQRDQLKETIVYYSIYDKVGVGERIARHSELERLMRLAPRKWPLNEGEAIACEQAVGSRCICRCGGFLHGIFRNEEHLPF